MPDIWLPTNTEPLLAGEAQRLKRPNTNWLDIIGRVRPGVNPRSLEAKLRVELSNWLASHESEMEPGEKQTWRQQTLNLIPGGAGTAAMRDQYKDGLKLLLIITESGGKVTIISRDSPSGGTYRLFSEIGSSPWYGTRGVGSVDQSSADDMPGTLT